MRSGLPLVLLLAAACGGGGPEVSAENGFTEGVQVSNVRFSGCVWPAPLPPLGRTPVHECLAGEARAYYDLFDPGRPDLGWQGRRTITVHRAIEGEELHLLLSPADDERDLDAPGPHGH